MTLLLIFFFGRLDERSYPVAFAQGVDNGSEMVR